MKEAEGRVGGQRAVVDMAMEILVVVIAAAREAVGKAAALWGGVMVEQEEMMVALELKVDMAGPLAGRAGL